MKRKRFISIITALFSGATVFGLQSLNQRNTSCVTQPDDLGPYYRKGAPLLKRLRRNEHLGVPLKVSGLVTSAENCSDRIMGATIEVWHADFKGIYDNKSNNYFFRGKVVTDKNGSYAFETIYPGNYGTRPKHIHFKISAKGFKEIITQLYFENDPTPKDYLAKKADTNRVVKLKKEPSDSLSCHFEIYLSKE